MFKKINCFALYNLYILYNVLGLGHISLGFFFDRVCIVKVLIGFMANIIWISRVRPYALGFRNLVYIF
jgi:hypothetical protein